MKKVLICLILVFGIMVLVGCQEAAKPGVNNEGDETSDAENEDNSSTENEGGNNGENTEDSHAHIFTFIHDEETHTKHYTCDCGLTDETEAHTDRDINYECDVCSYSMAKREYGLAMGTYYLPYNSNNHPAYITFYGSGKCEIGYTNEDKESYRQNYWVEDGKVYLDIDTAPKVHVFTILENALVYDPELTTASLWSSIYYNVGAVVYLLPNVSEEEMLSTVVMANEGLMEIPTIEKIYKKYEVTSEYTGLTNDVYVFMPDKAAAPTPHGDKVIGTDYTFTYSDSREILVYTQGRLMTLNEAFDSRIYGSVIITEDILSEINKDYHDCTIAHSYDEGVIAGESILYTCHICGERKTVSLPDDFSFTLTYSFDLRYDSKTGHLENGYNEELDAKCETTMFLDQRELMEIYRIFYNGNLFEIKEDFRATDQHVMPSYAIAIGYTVNGETVKFKILGASYITYSEWELYPELCYANQKVVKDYIMASEEYKALPPNTNMYD